MGKVPCDTVQKMLASVQQEVDDSELIFKLRTARQLVMVCEEDMDTLGEAVDEAELDDETKEKFRQLGYLD